MKKLFLILGSLFIIFLIVDFALGLANTDFNYWAMEKRLSIYYNQIGKKDVIMTHSEKDNDFSPQDRRNERESTFPVRIEKDSGQQNFRWEIQKTKDHSQQFLLVICNIKI